MQQTREFKTEIERLEIDITGISEMIQPKSGDLQSGEHRIIHTGTDRDKLGVGGVSTVLRKNTGLLQEICAIIQVKIESNPKDTVITQVYMPMSIEEDVLLEEIYEEIR